MSKSDDERQSAVAIAHLSLADARGDLDDAVSALSAGTDEKVMASSKVVDSLFRVVIARRHLDKLEGSASTMWPAPKP